MDAALLFEHLVSENLYNCTGWGASMYNGCLSESKSYSNGIKVGRIFILIDFAKDNLRPKLPIDKQEVLDELWNKVSPNSPTLEELEVFLIALREKSILF